MIFEKVIVIGSGKIASDCIEQFATYSSKIVGCEHEKYPLSSVASTCRRNNFEYRFFDSKHQVSHFLKETTDRTLIVSANNNFIFTDDILKNKQLKIINFHNAILPKHRGRNAPTWAIYEMDSVTGITWHEVDGGIDTGNIIIQKKIMIDSRMTALMLTRRCMEVGAEAFGECIASILQEECVSQKQQEFNGGILHLSKSVPNNGMLDLSWGMDKISAFLRALDYGKFQMFPPPRCVIMGNEYIIGQYHIDHSSTNQSARMVVTSDNIAFTDAHMSISITLNPI